MSEEEIRLDQTKKVFDTLAELISKNETCTYRYLIYDLLGFDGYYSTLISRLTITNALVEREEQQQEINRLKKALDVATEMINNKQQEIDRLNNIINELEKYLKEESKYDEYKDVFYREHMGYVLDKLKELKGNNK